MKRFITSALLSASLLTGAAAYAGPGYGHAVGGKDHVHYLAKKLDLTEEQKIAIEEIHQEFGVSKHERKQHHRQLMRSFAELDPGAADYRERVAEIAKAEAAKLEESLIRRGEIHARVYEILTPEQREQWKTLKHKRQHHSGNKE